MGAPQKVTGFAREPWGEELRPLLARVASGKNAARWLEGVVGAIERDDAVLFVARAEGAPVALFVLAFQKWPLAACHVLAAAAVPHSGADWAAATLPALRALARSAGADALYAEAMRPANRRWLERNGFAPRSAMMVCPC